MSSRKERPVDRRANRPDDDRKTAFRRREKAISGDREPSGHRTSENLLFGYSPVLERLKTRPRTVSKILVAEGSSDHRFRELADLARSSRVVLERTDSTRLAKVAGGDVNHQGVVAKVAAAEYSDADGLLESVEEDTLFLVLDGIEDPRNLGAILRNAECAAVDGVFIPERRAVGLTETVAKSSAGAVEHIKVARVTNINRLIEDLKARNVWVVGASGDADTEYTKWDWDRPTAIVMGNEGKGLHRLVAEKCDALVKIPMYGKIGSLNVSVAAGVLLFEAKRQRALARMAKDSLKDA